MTVWSVALLLAAAAGGAMATSEPPLQFAQRLIREQIMVRVPVRVRPATPAPRIEWEERRGPRCIAARSVGGAARMGPNSVDLILKDNRRIRAKLERSCPALDYYHGFYVRPNPDGRICADRDVIRSRVGGECEIDAFRLLRAEPRD